MGDTYITVHNYCQCSNNTRIEHLLDVLVKQGEKIMGTQAELTAAVNTANDKLKKIGSETTKLLTNIEELKVIIANGPVSAELQASVDALTAQAQVVDDLVPDSPITS